MQLLTMTAFEKLCREIEPVVFVYSTENQVNGFDSDSKAVAKFTDVVMMLNPNRICLKNPYGTLCFNGVKHILQLDNTFTGYVFAIICGDKNTDINNKTYVIVADRVKK